MDNIGPYKILEVLQKGPRPLYRVEAPDGRPAAIKAVAALGLSPEERERFMREAETCRLLEHPNLIRVYEAGEAGEMLYQAMELLEGADLDKIMSSGRTFLWDEKLSIMEQVCSGLAYAHDRSLVHRDIKPANLFLQTSGQVKVLDFGMVRLANSTLTRVGATLGTINYMAPEQLQGEQCTPASDVFSAGIVFYQLASGIHPFATRNQQLYELVSAITFEPARQLREVCADAPEGLESILDKALQKKPALRYPNAGELLHAIGLCRTLASQLVASGPAGARGQSEWPPNDGKTRVVRRPSPVPVPPAPPAPPSPKPDRTEQRSQGRYCPFCTEPVVASDEICTHCGGPLTRSSDIARIESRNPSLLVFYGLLTIVAILTVTLLIVLMLR